MIKALPEGGAFLQFKGGMVVRILTWFTIGFAVACGVGIWLVTGLFLVLLGVFALAAAIGLFFVRSWLSRIIAVVLVGFCVGTLWLFAYDSVYLGDARAKDGQIVAAEAVVTDYSFETDFGVAADARMVIDSRHFKVRLYLPEGDALTPGDVVKGEFRLRLTTWGAIQAQTHHQGDGIFLLAYLSEDAAVEHGDSRGLRYIGAQLRHRITGILDAAFPEDTGAFARALLLGDSTKLTYAQDTAFKISGIRHVIAVSGLHISILFSFMCMFLGRHPVRLTLIGIPILLLFTAVAGFTPSVVRACIMQILIIVADLINREYDPPSALAFAALVMLVVNPMTITSVSFQLSVGCLAGILLFYQPVYNYFLKKMKDPKGKSVGARVLRWCASSLAISLSTMIVTTPLSAYYFETVSIVGPVTNLLTLWVVSFIFYGLVLVCVLGSFWFAGAKIIAWMISWPIRYVAAAAKLLSSSVFSAVYTCSIYIVLWLVFCYVLLAVFAMTRKKSPAILVSAITVGLVVSVAASWSEPRLDNYRVTVLDVGQGQCILWQCAGENYLVDCGGDSGENAANSAVQLLLSQGITKLDGLILTHYDDDHAAGVVHLLTRIDTDALYIPDIDPDSKLRSHLQSDYADEIRLITESTVIKAAGGRVNLYTTPNTTEDNESSMCILFQTENCDILITGDRGLAGERALLENVVLPDLEILVAGHHGSKHSTGVELLHATTPEIAVICVGKDNYYGHPAQELLDRLKLYGCSIWRTDLDHTIIFRG